MVLPLPSHQWWGEDEASSEQLSAHDVRDISTRKVYPNDRLPGRCVRSYRTFSPLPTEVGGYFLRHFLVLTEVRTQRLTGTALYVVRTFLTSSMKREAATE